MAPTRFGGPVRLADRHRYLLLSAALLALMVSQTLDQQWSTDFWEHSAVVHELTTHLLHPRHPLLPVDATHPYFSPYTVAVAALGRLLGMGPIGALSVAAILNLVLFLVGFRLLVTRLVGNPHAAFYALVFTLVLWGLSPWRWSGIAVLLLVGVVGVSPGLLRTIPTQLLPGSLRADARLAKVADRYAFLGDCTGQYGVVLTDLGFPSLAVPTFGGKVVTTGYPIPFVADKAARDAEVQRFFDRGTGTGERRAILARYHVAYLLVDGAELDAPERLGQVVAEHDGLTLIATGPSRCRAPGSPS